MLEVRRVLYGDLKQQEQIIPGRLLGTRSAWMAQYSPLLSSVEFTRFYYLLQGLAPYLMLIIDPSNGSNHRRDRAATIGRRNLEWALYGHPDAVPLFQ
jgi:hypothetical protein